MKRAMLLFALILALVLGFVGLVTLKMQADTPARLIARLRRAEGGKRDQLLLRLSLARGDVIAELLNVFDDPQADPSFRAEALTLLFKRDLRERDPRCTEAFKRALSDPLPALRRVAATGIATYADRELHHILVASVTDPDPLVRRNAYIVFGGEWSRFKPASGIYEDITAEQREQLALNCVAQSRKESDPDLLFLSKTIVGREIEIRCWDAQQALGSGDAQRAKELLESAVALDPENRQGQVRMVRYYLETENREKALSLAREYGALIEVPRLPEAPIIDGDPEDGVWANAYSTDQFFLTSARGAAKPGKGKSRAYIGHHDGRVYATVLGYEEDLEELVTTHKNRDDDVWCDDCVELIFDAGSSGKDYIQFVLNSAGVLFDNLSGDKSKNFESEHRAAVFEDRGYWAVEFALDPGAIEAKPLTTDSLWSICFFRARIGCASEHGGTWPVYGFAPNPVMYPYFVFKDAPRGGMGEHAE